jgi:formamidopyrimidine-DNA glycosylase
MRVLRKGQRGRAGGRRLAAHDAAMPELPEVETVRAGLAELLGGARIHRARAHRPDLRTPIPDLAVLAGRRITGVARRAKYLLIATDGPTVLNHLGMTGVWRLADAARTHDHVELELADGRRVVFNDPRRFGMFELCRPDGGHAALDGLGPEPLGPGFTGEVLRTAARRHRRAALKAMIMDQRVVVGVGNIYASEACFRAGLRPGRAAGRVPGPGLDRLAQEIRTILAEAIAKGGSTIGDYRQVNGLSGLFQNTFVVYGRAGEPCRTCAGLIRQKTIAGRNSFWCQRCQA